MLYIVNEIVTDSFPSQFPSQIALFRHNFINFPSQFPSQIATFPVVLLVIKQLQHSIQMGHKINMGNQIDIDIFKKYIFIWCFVGALIKEEAL